MVDETRFTELEGRVAKLEAEVFSSASRPVMHKDDLRVFVERLKPKTHEERALYIGYYYEQIESKNNFSMKHIEDGYRKCKVKKYSNMPMLTKRLHEKRGWIIPDGQEGDTSLWTLTAEGEEHVKKALHNSGDDRK